MISSGICFCIFALCQSQVMFVEILGGVLWISSNKDDRRIFLGLKFSILGFFWVEKFGKYFFFGWLDLSRDFFGYSFNDGVALQCICFINRLYNSQQSVPGCIQQGFNSSNWFLIDHVYLEFPFAVVKS